MLEPVLYIGIAQSLFAGIIIATRRPQLLADRYLSAWLFIIAIEMILALLKLRWLEHLPYEIPFLVIPLVYGPLLYHYTRTMISERPRWHWTDMVHYVPFILFLGLSFLFRTQEESLRLPAWANPGRLAKIIYEFLVFASFTFYSTLVYILLTKHRKAIQEEFSYSSGRITLTWLLFVSITVYASYLMTFLSATIQMFVIRLPFDPKIFSFTGLTLFSFAFSFYGHRQAQIFSPPSQRQLQNTDDISANGVKYAKSNLRPEDLRKYTDQMDQLMKKKKLFLNPELTLSEVAAELKVPKHHLTQALNTELHKNFYAYINELRVKKFMDMVADDKYKRYTFLAIAFECGFNSKSTFNSVFKRITGFTPSEYIHSLGRTG